MTDSSFQDEIQVVPGASAKDIIQTDFMNDECEIEHSTVENVHHRLRKRKPKEIKLKKYICSIVKHCKFATDVKKHYAAHKRMHAIRKRNKCKKCVKKFKCSLCGYETNRNSNFKSHERIHSSEKPFECEICKKKFNQKWNLIRHIQRLHKDMLKK